MRSPISKHTTVFCPAWPGPSMAAPLAVDLAHVGQRQVHKGTAGCTGSRRGRGSLGGSSHRGRSSLGRRSCTRWAQGTV